MTPAAQPPSRTVLHDWHANEGASMQEFAGFHMPIQYSGIPALKNWIVSLDRVQHHQRDQLLGELVGSVVVRGAGDDDRQPVRRPVGQSEQVGAGLGSGMECY